MLTREVLAHPARPEHPAAGHGNAARLASRARQGFVDFDVKPTLDQLVGRAQPGHTATENDHFLRHRFPPDRSRRQCSLRKRQFICQSKDRTVAPVHFHGCALRPCARRWCCPSGSHLHVSHAAASGQSVSRSSRDCGLTPSTTGPQRASRFSSSARRFFIVVSDVCRSVASRATATAPATSPAASRTIAKLRST